MVVTVFLVLMSAVRCPLRTLLVKCTHGVMGPRDHGTTGPWDHARSHGAMGPRSHGTMHGATGPWDHGAMGPWAREALKTVTL